MIADRWGLTAPFWFAFVGSALTLALVWRQLASIAHSGAATVDPGRAGIGAAWRDGMAGGAPWWARSGGGDGIRGGGGARGIACGDDPLPRRRPPPRSPRPRAVRDDDLRDDVGPGRRARRDQPRAGVPRHRRATGGAGGRGGGDPRRAQPVPAGCGSARAAGCRCGAPEAVLRARGRRSLRGAGDGGCHRGDRGDRAGAGAAGRRGGDVRALLRLLRRDDRAGGWGAADVGAALSRLRRRRGVAAGGVLGADPDGAAQHTPQPDGKGVLAQRDRADLRLGSRARRVGGDRRGLRAPHVRRRRARAGRHASRACGSAR